MQCHPCLPPALPLPLLLHLHQVMHGSSRMASLFYVLPTTFVLPKEADLFAEAFQKASHGVEESITQPKGMNLW